MLPLKAEPEVGGINNADMECINLEELAGILLAMVGVLELRLLVHIVRHATSEH